MRIAFSVVFELNFSFIVCRFQPVYNAAIRPAGKPTGFRFECALWTLWLNAHLLVFRGPFLEPPQ